MTSKTNGTSQSLTSPTRGNGRRRTRSSKESFSSDTNRLYPGPTRRASPNRYRPNAGIQGRRLRAIEVACSHERMFTIQFLEGLSITLLDLLILPTCAEKENEAKPQLGRHLCTYDSPALVRLLNATLFDSRKTESLSFDSINDKLWNRGRYMKCNCC